jgi:hypothetical protein
MRVSAGRLERVLRLSGEFVVIVVGVLMALAVDQWAAKASDPETEVEYLEALLRDLDAEAEFFADATGPLRLLALADSALQEVGPVARGTAAFPVDTVRFLRQVITSRRTVAVASTGSPTFEELVSTGSLRLIRSAELRSNLIAYYSLATNIEARGLERSSGYAPLVRSLLPDDPLQGDDVSETRIRSYGVERAARAVREPDFVEALNRHAAYIQFLLPSFEQLRAELDALRNRVRSELLQSR